MISFTELNRENTDEVINGLRKALGDALYLSELVGSFLDYVDENGDTGVALCASHGCVIARIFDMGRYVFVYPIDLIEDADAQQALECVREYAVREEIPLRIVDVPKEELCEIVGCFRHMNIDAEDVEGELYRLEVKSECSLLSEIPELEDGDIALAAECEADIPKIASLAKDSDVNEYWGYDYREDLTSESVSDSYFFDAARAEFMRGVAMTLAVRYKGEFVGECVFYAFDYLGGCEIAVRVMKEFWGKKIGSRALSLAIELARKIGLSRLYTVIDVKNLRSQNMVRGEFMLVRESDGRLYYQREL